VLVGHCYEEVSFRPPYKPFVEVFVVCLQDGDVGCLTERAGQMEDKDLTERARPGSVRVISERAS
jgi:hypothetical protein